MCLLGERLVGAVVKAEEEGREGDGRQEGGAVTTWTGRAEPGSGGEQGQREGGAMPVGFEWRLETGGLTGGKKWGLIAEQEGAEVVRGGGDSYGSDGRGGTGRRFDILLWPEVGPHNGAGGSAGGERGEEGLHSIPLSHHFPPLTRRPLTPLEPFSPLPPPRCSGWTPRSTGRSTHQHQLPWVAGRVTGRAAMASASAAAAAGQATGQAAAGRAPKGGRGRRGRVASSELRSC